MLNPSESFDKRILDRNEAANMLSCSVKSVSYASKSRNQDFHALFPDLSAAEVLCDDFSCAYQREVLLQGRLYLTERNIYFYSKILWAFKGVESIEKRFDSVSGIFPNSISVKTEAEEFFFASFVAREITFDLITKLWTNVSKHWSIPMRRLDSSPGLDEDSGEEMSISTLQQLKRKSFEIFEYDDELEELEHDEITDQDQLFETESPISKASFEVHQSSLQENSEKRQSSKSEPEYIPRNKNRKNSTRSAPETRIPSRNEIKGVSILQAKRSVSPFSVGEEITPLGLILLTREPESLLQSQQNSSSADIFHQKPIIKTPIINENDSLVGATPMVSFTPISCECDYDKSKFKVILDHSFNTPIDNLWKILFGSLFSGDSFIRTFWKDIGYKGIEASPWDISPDIHEKVNENMLLEDMNVGYQQNLEYIVPSKSPIGPKEIQTFVKNRVIYKEASSSAICILQISNTPSVPSGDCFEVHMRTCLTHDGYVVIERAAVDALSSYFEKLQNALESHFSCNFPCKIPDSNTPVNISNRNQTFSDHPLEKELLKINVEETIGITPLKPGFLMCIRERLSGADIIYLLFATVIFMTYQLLLLHSRIHALAEQLEELRISIQKR